jgi:hypothetical protein
MGCHSGQQSDVTGQSAPTTFFFSGEAFDPAFQIVVRTDIPALRFWTRKGRGDGNLHPEL